MPIPFITVEGPIGVGKTSLSKAIAESQNFHLLKEIVDENPFLNKFYDDIEEWSFQTEMFFLCNRYKQLSDIKKEIMLGGNLLLLIIIFLKILYLLNGRLIRQSMKSMKQFTISLRKICQSQHHCLFACKPRNPYEPNCVRGREFEKNMDPAYLMQLSEDYHAFIEHFEKTHPEIPVLRFNGDDFDFVQNDKDLQYMLKEIDATIRKGVTLNEFT